MGNDEDLLIKRRNLPCTSSDSAKSTPEDVYKRTTEFEEAEALSRSRIGDINLFKKICVDIRKIFSDIAELKTQNTKEAKEMINSKQIEASLQIVALKKLNRLEKIRTKFGRDALQKEKKRVDSTYLLLQNLLYEADYLNKEVAKCLQFKSKDQDIDLIPVEEFYKNAPPEVARPDVTKKDEHQLQLARLEWELRQRRELADTCNELVESKNFVAAAINLARTRINALAPQLQDVLDSTKPLQDFFALRLDEKRDKNKLASLLPQPLFLLYANASAYSEVVGTDIITVVVSGDEDEARRLEESNSLEKDFFSSNESDSDQEQNDDEDQKKRHHRPTKISKEEKAEAKKKEVLKLHPLNVQLTTTIPDGTSFTFTFNYLIHIKIVTIKFTVCLPETQIGVSAADVLDAHSILNELYHGDTGCSSPHPATTYLLKYAGIVEDFQHFIPQLGRPYIWAQRMCGLDFIALNFNGGQTERKNEPCPSLSALSVQNFMFTLKRRLKSRLQLNRELQELETGKIFMAKLPSPVNLSGSLTQWQSIDWLEYSQAQSVERFISEEMVFPGDMLYRAIITRQSAKLIALIALKSDYPKTMPLFSLTLHWNGTLDAETNEDIKDIERIVNAEITSGNNNYILSLQMIKLIMGFDIFLETSGSSEFLADQKVITPVRGRNRSKLYKLLDHDVFKPKVG